MWIVVGIGVLEATPLPADDRRWLFHEHIPVAVRVAGWIVTGLIGVAFAFVRYPLGRDRWAFSLLLIMPGQRFVSYLVSWAATFFPGDYGYQRGFLAAAVWGACCGIVMICAGWPDPLYARPPHDPAPRDP